MFKEIDNLIAEIMHNIIKLEKAYYVVSEARHLVNKEYVEFLFTNLSELLQHYKALDAFRRKFKITYGLKEEKILSEDTNPSKHSYD